MFRAKITRPLDSFACIDVEVAAFPNVEPINFIRAHATWVFILYRNLTADASGK